MGVEYGEEKIVAPGIRVRFTDAGHLLGSASIEVWLQEEDVSRKLLFSGDIGNLNQPLICDPVYPEEADYVVMGIHLRGPQPRAPGRLRGGAGKSDPADL